MIHLEYILKLFATVQCNSTFK